jgi:hypothetical protein
VTRWFIAIPTFSEERQSLSALGCRLDRYLTTWKNWELLRRITGRYDVLITMDRGIEFQQQISIVPFGIVIVRARSNRMQHLSPLEPAILAAIAATQPGHVQRVGA